LTGTSDLVGAIIRVYSGVSATALSPTNGSSWTAGNPATDRIVVPAGGTWYWKNNNQAGEQANCNAGSNNTLANGSYRVTQQLGSSCESDGVWICLGTPGNTALPVISTSPITPITTSLTGTSANNAYILLYVNGEYVTQVQANGTGAWSISSLSFTACDVVQVRAMVSGLCISDLTTGIEVSLGQTAAPSISGTYCGTITSVSGTSSAPNGTTITVYNGTGTGDPRGTATVVGGSWTASVSPAFSPGNTITARAQNTPGCQSQSVASSSVVVGTQTANDVTITLASIIESEMTISGSCVGCADGTVIRLYIDGFPLYRDFIENNLATTTTTDGLWTINLIDPVFYVDGEVTVTATTSGNCEGVLSDPTMVVCTPPGDVTVTPPVDNVVCEDSILANVQVESEDLVIYQLYIGSVDPANATGSSVLGTGGTITLSTDPLTESVTLVVEAIKFPYDGSCSEVMTTTVPVTVNNNPDPSIAVAAVALNLCEGEDTDIHVENSQLNVEYRLKDNADNSLVGVMIEGDGGTISFPTGALAVTTTFKVEARSTLAPTFCTVDLTTLATVTVEPAVVLSLNASSDPDACGAATGSITLEGLVATTDYTVSFEKNGNPDSPGVISSDGSGNLIIPNLGAGSYTDIFVTSALGCESNVLAGPFDLSDPGGPTIAIGTVTDPTQCAPYNGSIQITGVTDGTYDISYVYNVDVFTTVVNNVVADANGLLLDNLAPGNYSNIFITNTVSNCNSNTLATPVSLNPPAGPAAPTGDATQTFCSSDAPIVADLVATGTGIQWYADPSGGTPLAGATALVNGTSYYATQTVGGCESSSRFEVAVTIVTNPTIALGSSTDANTCGGDGSIVLNFANVPDGTYAIEYEDGNGDPQSLAGVAVTGGTATIAAAIGVYNNLSISVGSCSSSQDVDVTIIQTNCSDLRVNKTVDNSTPTIGTDIVFTITVTNDGPNNATGVEVTDVIPSGYSYVGDNGGGAYDDGSGVWTIGNLNNGASISLGITVTVLGTGTYANTASVTGDQDDDDSGNNTSTNTPNPGGSPESDLSISKTVDDSTPNVGEDVVFTITVSNAGPADATGVVVTDQLPNGYAYVSDNGSGAYNSGTGVWTIGTVVNGSNTSLQITATVLAPGAGVSYLNTASITSSDQFDPDTSNDEDDETVSVGSVIEANNDDFTATPVNGYTGGTTASVLDNDELNGASIDPAEITIGITDDDGLTGVSISGTGVITIPAGTPSGTYTITYQICEVLNPANCDSGTVTIEVGPALIEANDDDFTATPVNGYTGGTTASVLDNDELNGASIDPAEITIGITDDDGLTGVSISGTGVITIPTGTPSGTYTITYQICEVLNPANCDDATVTIEVGPALIEANDDDFTATPVNGYTGGTTASVLDNDELDGSPIDPNDITISILDDGGLFGVSINANGEVVIPSGISAGSYVITYQICEILNPTNCDDATITIEVGPPALIEAINDNFSASPINAYTGGTTSGVLSNDLLGGAAVDPADVMIDLTNNGGLTGASINMDGQIVVPAGTAPGTYILTYQICEILNPSNCDDATVTIEVEPAQIIANDDNFTSNPIIGSVGGIAGNVLTNDLLNNVAVISSEVAITVLNNGGISGLVINPDGTVSVPGLLMPDDYVITYQICQVAIPTNCDVATVIIRVELGSDDKDCDMDGIPDYLDPDDCDFKTQIVITPNGDALNQYWKIRGIDNFPNNEVIIFNRWGNEVWKVRGYSNLDQRKRFEGRGNLTNGGDLPDGTYFYVVDLKDGKGPRKGFLVIKR
jgi:uncharacterized repeat protein (TIGR01451 family)/gliding motility-associated-like protein